MSKRHVLVSILVAITAMASVAVGQPCFKGTDEAAVAALIKDYIDCIRDARWEDMAKLTNVDELDGFKASLARVAEGGGQKDIADQIRGLVGDSVLSSPDIMQMSSARVYELVASHLLSIMSGLLDMKTGEMVYLGSVCESDQKAYAVTKVSVTVGGKPTETVDVVPLLKGSDGKWQLGLKAEIRALAQSLGRIDMEANKWGLEKLAVAQELELRDTAYTHEIEFVCTNSDPLRFDIRLYYPSVAYEPIRADSVKLKILESLDGLEYDLLTGDRPDTVGHYSWSFKGTFHDAFFVGNAPEPLALSIESRLQLTEGTKYKVVLHVPARGSTPQELLRPVFVAGSNGPYSP
jgi:hypothetical protein